MYDSCHMCVLQLGINGRVVLWRFCVPLFVFQFSSRFDLCIVVDNLGKVSCISHFSFVLSLFCLCVL